MPEAFFDKASARREGFGFCAVSLEGFALDDDVLHVGFDTSVAQGGKNGYAGLLLLKGTLSRIFGFFEFAAWLDAASAGGFGQCGWRDSLPDRGFFADTEVLKKRHVIGQGQSAKLAALAEFHAVEGPAQIIGPQRAGCGDFKEHSANGMIRVGVAYRGDGDDADAFI